MHICTTKCNVVGVGLLLSVGLYSYNVLFYWHFYVLIQSTVNYLCRRTAKWKVDNTTLSEMKKTMLHHCTTESNQISYENIFRQKFHKNVDLFFEFVVWLVSLPVLIYFFLVLCSKRSHRKSINEPFCTVLDRKSSAKSWMFLIDFVFRQFFSVEQLHKRGRYSYIWKWSFCHSTPHKYRMWTPMEI